MARVSRYLDIGLPRRERTIIIMVKLYANKTMCEFSDKHVTTFLNYELVRYGHGMGKWLQKNKQKFN